MPAPPGARAEPEAEATPRGPSSVGAPFGPDPWQQFAEDEGIPPACFDAGWRRAQDGGYITPWGAPVISGYRLLPDGHLLSADGVSTIHLEPPKRSAADYLDTNDHAPPAAAAERSWGPPGSVDGDPFSWLAHYAQDLHEDILGRPAIATLQELRDSCPIAADLIS